MRLLRLDLLAFGPFTGVTLPFDQGEHGLHVVVGRNEAGKSSALRALRGLLYGIPVRTSDNFTHPNESLRIGATIRDERSGVRTFLRRKGLKKTLRESDDETVLDDSVLGEMVRGLDEVAFQQRYGLTHDQLTAGGAELAAGKGELGQTLFAAGAGLLNLDELRTQLNEEAELLFKPRGQNQRINRLLTEYRELRGRLSDWNNHHSSVIWQQQSEAKMAVERQRAELELHLQTKEAERQRLDRLRRALPRIVERRRLQRDLSVVSNAPRLASDFAERRHAATTQQQIARQALDQAQAALTSIDRELAELSPSSALLAADADIRQAAQELSLLQKAEQDRPQLTKRRDELRVDGARLLRDLWGDAAAAGDAKTLTGFGLNAAEREAWSLQKSRARELSVEQTKLSTTLAHAETRAANIARERRRVDAAIQESAPEADETELSVAVQEAQRHGHLTADLTRARDELAELNRETQLGLQQLAGWSESLDDLETTRLPSFETIERFEQSQRDADTQSNRWSERRAELSQQSNELDRQIGDFRKQHDLPTEEDLRHARQVRDDAVRQFLHRPSVGGSMPYGYVIPDSSEVATRQQATDTGTVGIEEIERLIAEADRIADRLRRDAGQVTQLTAWLAERQGLSTRVGEADESLAQAEMSAAQLKEEWLAEWQPLDIEPLTPREMRRWLEQAVRLRDLAAQQRRQAAIVSQLEELQYQLARQLAAALNPPERNPRSPRAGSSSIHTTANMALGESTLRSDAPTRTARREPRRRKVAVGASLFPDESRSDFNDDRRDNFAEVIAVGKITHCADIVDTRDSLPELLQQAKQHLDENQQRRISQQRLEQERRSWHQQDETVQDELRRTNAELTRWQREWQDVIEHLRLPTGTTPETVGYVLEQLDRAAALSREADELQSRLESLDADQQRFATLAAKLIARVSGTALAAGGLPVDSTITTPVASDIPLKVSASDLYSHVTQLHERLTTAQCEAARRQQLERQRQIEQQRRQQSEQLLTESNTELSVLCREAGCDSPELLPAIEQQAAQRAEFDRLWQLCEQDLQALAAPQTLDAFLAEVEQVTAEELSTLQAQLTDEVTRLRSEVKQLNQQVWQAQHTFAEWTGGDDAAEMDEQGQQLLAKLRSESEQFLRVRLASLILQRSIEQYREKAQGPILQRASDHFTELTLGSFRGLRADYDHRGEAAIVALRPDGKPLRVEGLSTGTRDQLYLALRLASLEHDLDHHTPLPFVLDDILIQFDDQRAAAALRVLSRLSRRTQVIYFTHHEHLAELAQQAGEPGTVFVQKLESRC